MENDHNSSATEKYLVGFANSRIIYDDSGAISDYELLEVNSDFETLIGLPASDLIGHRIKELIPAIAQNENFSSPLFGEDVLKMGGYQFESYSPFLNRFLRVNVYVTDPNHAMAYVTDFTDEVNQISELERFFSINLDLLCIADTEGNFIKVNKEWEHILGYTKDDLENRTFLEFIHPDDLDSTYAAMADLERQEKVIGFVNRYRTKDGDFRYIEWRSQPYGNLIYAAARDITDHVETRQALQEEKENFRTFFESMDDLIFVGSPDGKILYTNPAVSSKLGYSTPELENMHLLEVHPLIYRGEAEKIFTEMFKGMRDYCPLPLQRKDGSYLPAETRIWFGKWGGTSCIYGISKDLSKTQAALEKFQKLFENSPALMAVTRMTDNRFIEVNTSFLEKLGYEREEIVGKTSIELGLFVDVEARKELYLEIVRTGQVRDLTTLVRTKDGRVLDGIFNGAVIDNQGEKSLLTVMMDVTRQKRAEDELRRSEASYRLILNHSFDLLWNLNAEGIFTYVSPSWKRMTGYEPESLIGTSFAPLVHPDDQNVCWEYLRKMSVTKQGGSSPEYRVKHADGGWYWHSGSGIPVLDDSGEFVSLVGISRDISERKEFESAQEAARLELERLNKELERTAAIDQLTQIWNRRYFEKVAEIEIARLIRYGGDLALIMIDIDHFKSVNDNYGHQAGDIVLIELTCMIRDMIRPTDTFARWGGEEFVILTPHVPIEKMLVFAERIRCTVEQHQFKSVGSVTVSVGLAQFQGDDNLDGLIRRADDALYSAKRDGRNRVALG